jgi:hypothetical protein
MADPEFRYTFNAQTGRWDVMRRHLDGTESLVRDYATPSEAMDHVARANNQPPGAPK